MDQGIPTDIGAYFRKEAARRAPYEGQLTAQFQAALARHHRDVTRADCEFYHTVDFGGGELFEGAWDLRGHEAAYLGNVDLRGRRVIEFGPASGSLSSYMAGQGADLTVFDLPIGGGPEIMPFPNTDTDAKAYNGVESMTQLRNSWWYTKRKLGFEARAVYADIYDPPADIGRYEVSVFGAILVHLSHPFRALQRAAAITDDMMIVTDMASLPPNNTATGIMQFSPTPPPLGFVHWWNFSVNAISQMLLRLGFTEQTLTVHTPAAMASRPSMFTVVARRQKQQAATETRVERRLEPAAC